MKPAAVITALALMLPPGAAMAADQVALVDTTTGEWHLGDGHGGVRTIGFGNPGDVPFMGDWDCDGVDTPGLYRDADGFVYLRNANTQGVADVEFFFGDPGDVPLAGDFDGDGCDTVSVYRPAEQRVYVINRLGSGSGGLGGADASYLFGNPGDVPFVGDFDGDGVDTVGLHREATGFVYVRNSHTQGVADRQLFFGDPDDRLVAGDWDGDGTDGPAVFRPGDEVFFLRDTLTQGVAQTERRLCVGRGAPVAGAFVLPPPPPPPTVTLPGGVQLIAQRQVSIRVDEREAVALTGGTELWASWPGGRTQVTTTPTTISTQRGDLYMTFTYRGTDGKDTGLCWRQLVAADQTEVVAVQPWRKRSPRGDGSIVLAWQVQGGDLTAQLDAAPGLTVTSPVWWHIRADGSLGSNAEPGLVAAAHARGIEVWPAIASLEPNRAHAALASAESRQALAADISGRARALGVDGVNIDIEGYRMADAAAVVDFARRLTASVHAWGGKTSLDLTMRSESWELTVEEGPFWSTAPDRRRLADAVDYLALMAYDQHNRLRPGGPVAAPGWVEEGVAYLLRYADPGQIILGVPFYGRIWDPSALDKPRAVGLGTIASLAASGASSPDPVHGIERVDLADGRFLWAEVPARLAHRRALVDDLGLAGIAAWRLGFDPPDVWAVVTPR